MIYNTHHTDWLITLTAAGLDKIPDTLYQVCALHTEQHLHKCFALFTTDFGKDIFCPSPPLAVTLV